MLESETGKSRETPPCNVREDARTGDDPRQFSTWHLTFREKRLKPSRYVVCTTVRFSARILNNCRENFRRILLSHSTSPKVRDPEEMTRDPPFQNSAFQLSLFPPPPHSRRRFFILFLLLFLLLLLFFANISQTPFALFLTYATRIWTRCTLRFRIFSRSVGINIYSPVDGAFVMSRGRRTRNNTRQC